MSRNAFHHVSTSHQRLVRGHGATKDGRSAASAVPSPAEAGPSTSSPADASSGPAAGTSTSAASSIAAPVGTAGGTNLDILVSKSGGSGGGRMTLRLAPEAPLSHQHGSGGGGGGGAYVAARQESVQSGRQYFGEIDLPFEIALLRSLMGSSRGRSQSPSDVAHSSQQLDDTGDGRRLMTAATAAPPLNAGASGFDVDDLLNWSRNELLM